MRTFFRFAVLWILSSLAAPGQSLPAHLPEVRFHLTARPWTPLNTPRTDPLDKVEAIVNQLVSLQYWNPAQPSDLQNGSLIDPFGSGTSPKEWQYATPYFSFAVATVVSAGRSTNLLEAGARALDHSTADIAGLDGSAQANDSHGEFFGAPMMKALRLYKQIASQYPTILTPARIATWESRLQTSRVSYMNNGVPQNWRTYGMKGEWLRVQDGLVPRNAGTGAVSYQGVSYIEHYWLNEQRARYLRDRDSATVGIRPYFLMYHDDDTNQRQNFAYHGGATGNLLDMIRNGYDGASRDEIASVLRFAARSSLLQMSGNGDAPASGRTGNHVWNDIVYGNTFGQMAEMSWADGDALSAGQFRRAERLAFQSAWRFQQERGWFSVTKSLFPPAHRNVYFSWSALSNYNGYTEIHSAEDYATRLSEIPEQATPAEIGGFAFNLDPQFGVAFANAGGMQLQMVTRGSSQTANDLAGGINCFTLGIVRFSRPDWESRLGPADGWMASDWSAAISCSPTFLESGTWKMVSELTDRYGGTFTPSFVHPLLVRGTLAIVPKAGQTGPSFAMDLTITPDGVLIDTKRSTGSENFGLIWPLLEFDGKHVLSRNTTGFVASSAYPKQSANRVITQAETASLSGGVTLATTEPNYTGSGYAVFPSSGGAVQWSNVDGGAGGASTVGFRYTLQQTTAASRSATLRVNGVPQTITFVHTGSPRTYNNVLSFPMDWHQVHVPVTLLAGASNTIQLEGATSGGINIDEMRVFPADAAQAEPDQQNFISLDAAPVLDATAAVRRSAYGDQRPIRVTNSGQTVATFVYPRKAADPTAESVRTSFVRNGADFSSVLGRVRGNLYVGRTSAGGEGTGIDLNNDGTNDVSFSANCAFVLQLTNGAVTAIESDRFVTATIGTRQIKLAAYTPIAWSATDVLWNNQPVSALSRQFEAKIDFTPESADAYAGFAATGAASLSELVAAVRFGSNGRVTPVTGAPLVDLPYKPGTSYRLRVLFDLASRTYTIWVKPNNSPERRLVTNAALPAWVTSAQSLGAFAFLGGTNASSVQVTNYGSPFTARINFQDTTSAGYSGYLPDTGNTYGNRGNGFTYGWIEGPNTTLTRNRNSTMSPDERYDTLNQMQYNSPPTETHTWEIQVPNGTYSVKLVCGDPDYIDSVYYVLAEGMPLVQGTPTTAQRFIEGTAMIDVKDGRLTLTNGAGSIRNKVCFIEITSVGSAAYPYESYSDWAAAYFAGGTANPNASPNADPNGNGIPNALEYGAGSNPVTSGASVPLIVDVSGPGTVDLQFFRSAKALSARYSIWQSSNLAQWSLLWDSDADADFSSPFVYFADPATDSWVKLRIPIELGISKRFFRLEAGVR